MKVKPFFSTFFSFEIDQEVDNGHEVTLSSGLNLLLSIMINVMFYLVGLDLYMAQTAIYRS